ncbi:MAG TPA: hypothetical protein VHN37_00590 [Actinomycetota bacterium]|nr:hypothetical protein [Actinomycetota bacterium]
MILLIIAVIVYFVVTSGDDEGTEDTPTGEETTSQWEGEPGAALVLAGDADGAVPPRVIVRAA